MDQRRAGTLPTDFRKRDVAASPAANIRGSACLSTDFRTGKQPMCLAERVVSSASGLARDLLTSSISSDSGRSNIFAGKASSSNLIPPPFQSHRLDDCLMHQGTSQHFAYPTESFRSSLSHETGRHEFESFWSQSPDPIVANAKAEESNGTQTEQGASESVDGSPTTYQLAQLLYQNPYSRVPTEWLPKWEAILKDYEDARQFSERENLRLDKDDERQEQESKLDISAVDSKTLNRLKLVLGHLSSSEHDTTKVSSFLRNLTRTIISHTTHHAESTSHAVLLERTIGHSGAPSRTGQSEEQEVSPGEAIMGCLT